MLELSWGGTKAHTNQGFNIGKPPYGYLAERMRHPVKMKAEQGKAKHRLVPDPVRGPVVTQLFLWRALNRLGYQAIADKLNFDPNRYPPPDPILGEGRRRVGAWTASNVREILDNPKHTGYMVWNRRKRPRPERGIKGKVNPPSAWVWSAVPTHEPLVTREIFEAATTVGRFRKGSRSHGPNGDPKAKRTYLLRSYLRCDLCGRRAWGHTVRTSAYYRCSPDPKNHSHLPWYPNHPAHVVVREDRITAPLMRFFEQRIFGDGREHLLAQSISEPEIANVREARSTALKAEIASLQQRQMNLLRELEQFEPSGDDEFDQAWRSGIQARFAAILAEQRRRKELLAEQDRQEEAHSSVDLSLLEKIPQSTINLARLPEDKQRRLYDAFHLELCYNHINGELNLRVTITADTVAALAATVEAATGNTESGERSPNATKVRAEALRARGGTRTRTLLRAADFKSAVSAIPPPGPRRPAITGRLGGQR